MKEHHFVSGFHRTAATTIAPSPGQIRNVILRKVILYDEQTGKRFRKKEEIEGYLTRYFQQQQEDLNARQTSGTHCAYPERHEELLRSIEGQELAKYMKALRNGKAAGPDGIPNEFLKSLQPSSMEALLNIFNDVLQTTKIPMEWKDSTVCLLYKGQGKPKEEPNSYRLITLQSNVAKLFAAVINGRLQNTYDGHLNEAQNGFRHDRWGSDNLFILTQLIELTQKTGREMYVAFLDLEKAYDSIPHHILWQKLHKLGLPKKTTENNPRHVYGLHKHIPSRDLQIPKSAPESWS